MPVTIWRKTDHPKKIADNKEKRVIRPVLHLPNSVLAQSHTIYTFHLFCGLWIIDLLKSTIVSLIR